MYVVSSYRNSIGDTSTSQRSQGDIDACKYSDKLFT